MKVLFVSAVLPYPLRSGGQVRIYNLLKLLSTQHEITLCSFIRSKEEEAYVSKLSFCKKVHLVHRGKALQLKYLLPALVSNKPWLLATYDNEEMRTIISKELEAKTYDLVHIEPFYVYPSLPKISIPMVVCEHNIEYNVYESFADTVKMPLVRSIFFSDAKKIKKWEETVWKKAAHIVAVSSDDSHIIQRNVTDIPLTVVPNGVNTDYYKNNSHAISESIPRFLFVGDFSWFPNKEAVRILIGDIWPSIHLEFPKSNLTIVGKHMPLSVVSNTSLGILAAGEISDIRDEFEKADFLLAPMTIGGGTKFKILEAMATGTIVITTKEGAMGLPVTDRKELCIVKTKEEYVKIIRELLNNPDFVSTIRKRGRVCVEKNFSWNTISKTLDTVWRNSV